jgi:hypothetical protein
MAALPENLMSSLIALQIVAFGWRLNREITVGDDDRKTRLPLPDYINLASLLATVTCGLVLPLGWGYSRLQGPAIVAGYALIAFHPISEAAHYRLFSKKGRSVYLDAGRDYPWITDQEVATVILSVLCASAVAAKAWIGSQ